MVISALPVLPITAGASARIDEMGYRYALSKVIAYARQDMPGRSHFKNSLDNMRPVAVKEQADG